MSLTKRTRFEVLRRDGHTCRYCGSSAPDATLTVDHVVPVALGGTDDPSNLVAACRDCNSGKSSAAPDSSLVAEVRDDAIRHAEMIMQAYGVLVEQMNLRDDYIEQFEEAYSYRLPDDYQETVGRWFRMAVPVELIVEAARQASRSAKSFRGDGRFRYLCGIVWNQVHAVSEAAFDRATIDGAFMTDESQSALRFDAYDHGWMTGWDRGRLVGLQSAWLSHDSPVAATVDSPANGTYISAAGVSGAEFEARDLAGWWT